MLPFVQDYLSDARRRKRLGDRLVAFACVAWLVGSGWTFFHTIPPEIIDNHTAKTMQDRMRTCEGSFSQRFECKQNLLLTGERWGFAVAIDRLILMCAPPIAAWIVWRAVRRNH